MRAINFIVFGVTSALGLIFASLFAKTLSTGNPIAHFEHAASFWLAGIVLAALIAVLLRETGSGRYGRFKDKIVQIRTN